MMITWTEAFTFCSRNWRRERKCALPAVELADIENPSVR